MTLPRRAAAVLPAAALTLTLAACGGGADAAERGSDDDPVRIGVVGASQPEWQIFTDLAAEEGITVEIVDFSDYTQPNPALTDGDLDLNQFQHILYLAQYNEADGQDLTPIGATAVYPLGLYSEKYDSVEDIPDGEEIAIPNDVTNQGRALRVLEAAGLVTLAEDAGVVPDTTDVDTDASTVTVTPVEANQTVVALDSIAGSIVNNDFVDDAGLDPADALFADDAASDVAEPYINVWVARAEDAEDETLTKLVEIYHDQQVLDAVQESAGGTASFADQDAAELQEILAEVQADL
ncbi:MetQ/NlpA family ABC transporter substrate-binding protein [Georgenia sp. TF02-10]|uniref:MetQ/NlpA family ABC transporter substrate-binding protein n=1 Tax=Georgenia sp. TF02-10 TaxID=2917725 RepID=UPI001FA7004B|nr:MetQ/NlpA family ABC transporter substrate-binding protein [Georgenia sp. TF02-10]UNX54057.1 MetQ/NlpA family ABC transporter substrate-binding protein [Georgenia sp. TF02-10]